MPGAQAAAVAAVQRRKKQKRELQRMATNRNQVQGKMDKFFSKFDQDQAEGGGGGWDDEALKKALIASYPEKSDQVDQAAIDFVKSVADVSKNNVIDRDEVVAAIQAYTTYIDRKDEVL